MKLMHLMANDFPRDEYIYFFLIYVQYQVSFQIPRQFENKPFGDKHTPYFVVQLKCKKQSWYGLEFINSNDVRLNTILVALLQQIGSIYYEKAKGNTLNRVCPF